MTNLYIIITLLLIAILGTLLFRKNIFRLFPIEIVMIGFGVLLGPYVLNFLSKTENIQLEPIINLLIGATALFAGLKLKLKGITKIKEIFILAAIFFISASAISLGLFYVTNHFIFKIPPYPLIFLTVLSASILPSYYFFSSGKEMHKSLISIISNIILVLIFLILIILTPLFKSGSPLSINYWLSILFSLIDILMFSGIMYFLFKNSNDQNEFLVVFFGIAIFNVVISYILNINAASNMFFIGFIIANTSGKEYFKFKDIINSLEHPFYIGLLLFGGSLLTFNHSMILSLPYLIIHFASITITLFIFKHYVGKFSYGVIPQTGILYTILLSMVIINNSLLTQAASSVIIANVVLYTIYYFVGENKS